MLDSLNMYPNAPQIRTANDIHNALVSMGGRTNAAARYSQSAKISSLANRTVMNQVAAGYCEGVSLDWIRRALLPKPRSDGSAPRRLAFAGNKPGRDLRHADTQIKFETKQAEYQNNWSRSVLQQHAVSNWYPAFEAKYQRAANQIQNSSLSQQEKNRRLQRLGELEAAEQDDIESKRAQLAAAKQTWDGSAAMQKIWWGFSQALDKRLKDEREAAGKQGGPSRGFSRLHITAAQNSREFSGGISEFMRMVLMDPAFQTNCAAQLVVAPPGAAGGHAVAVLRLNTSNYVFFEPNFGTYIFDLASKLLNAVVFLFRDGYPRIEGQGHDAHVYQVNGRINGRYTIFQGRETSVPGPDQILRPA